MIGLFSRSDGGYMISPSIHRILLALTLATSLALAGGLGTGAVSAQSVGPDAPVTISGYMFHPNVLGVTVGTTVSWTNFDGVAHTTTSTMGVWHSGSLTRGMSFRHTFNTPGTFWYHCMIHPFMHGVIVVRASAGRIAASVNPVMNGHTTVITGRDFTPNARVFVEWRRPDGTMPGFWLTTRPDGSFAFTLLADPRHGCGPRTFTVFDSVTRMWSPQFVLTEIC
jgi:plastocyanin